MAIAAPRPVVHDAIAKLQRLTDLFQERRAQLADEVGLTEQQWEVLERIATERFMPSMFARHRESSAAAVSRLVRQLIDKRLVSVSVSPNDGRQRQYVLTTKGRRTLATLRASREAAIAAIWAPLDPRALAAFAEVSGTLIRRIETYAARE
ncbi:MAG: MarR family winged helix-turn-helix transcriptional regulator [Candidatus Binatia bacterium]